MRILIVDDQQIFGNLTARKLTKAGHTVTVATTPIYPSESDYVIIDWQPHGADQLELCESARVPHVVFTGDSRAVPAGTPVIDKPDFRGLLALVETVARVMG